MRTDSAGAERNLDLDIIKGFLVLVMLLYHCASISDFPSLHGVLRKIDFVHYAFLLITGFLCGYHYYPIVASTRRKVQMRLFSRGIKILALFACGNVAYHVLGYGSAELKDVPLQSKIAATFLVPFLGGPDIAFGILYLIALFLFGAGLIIGTSWVKWLISLVIILPVMVNRISLVFMAFGCAGMLVGILAREGRLKFLNSLIHHRLWIFPLVLVPIVAFVPTPDRWHVGAKGPLLFFLLETPLWFFAGLWLIRQAGSQRIQQQIVLLGRYTLLAYILQMIVARLTFHVLYRAGFRDLTYYGLSLVIVGGTMWLAVLAVERMRMSGGLWDRAFKVVFP